MITDGPTKDAVGVDLAAFSDAFAPVLDEARELSGRPHLKSADARRRYALILHVLAAADVIGGLRRNWLAQQLGCSSSNMSRLIKDARRTLATSAEGTAS